jgi:hypothetical protein
MAKKKPEQDRKKHIIAILLDEDEKKAVIQKAGNMGLQPGQYCRSVVLKHIGAIQGSLSI